MSLPDGTETSTPCNGTTSQRVPDQNLVPEQEGQGEEVIRNEERPRAAAHGTRAVRSLHRTLRRSAVQEMRTVSFYLCYKVRSHGVAAAALLLHDAAATAAQNGFGTHFVWHFCRSRYHSYTVWMAGLGDWGNFVFWVTFSNIFKHQVQGICGQVHWLKKPMLDYGKNMPRNNQFSVFLSEKNKILPRKKNLPTFLKNLPKKQNLPSPLVQP